MSQPPLSIQIRAFEEELGVKLFDRDQRNVALTAAGAILLQEMRKILREIQDGTFAEEWVAEDDAGRPNFTKLVQAGEQHPIEEVGRKLRGLMSWVDRPITETA